MLDPADIARELLAAHSRGTIVPVPPTSRDPGFDTAAGYRVEAEVARLRRAEGRSTVGRKVGFANKAMWRILKLDTLAWAHMYDDTVHYSHANRASLPLGGRLAPRIEPEIVFKLREPLNGGSADAAAILASVEWIALGFEINDCVFPNWEFKPADFVAALGLHAALIVGEPRPVARDAIPLLVEQLPTFKLRLLKNGQLVEEGSGKASLRSPALCLGELAGAIARQPGADPLEAGEIVSTGTLTTPQPIAAGEEWRAEAEGLDLPALTLAFQVGRSPQRMT
jgi:2-oxo-3-hexenedioate decarboxylase